MDIAKIESKVCYYDILGIDINADESEIKKAYKQLALKVHPDKASPENVALCTRVFQKIKDAYQCLSNPKDRKWYDSHRKFIIKEVKEESEEFKSNINIWNYFGTCYNGFDDQPDGFFTIYRNLFDQIAMEESQFNNNKYPSFGTSTSPWEVTGAFYKIWSQFTTSRPFAKEYKLCEAENRQIRRLMEKENKKNDARLRREFSDNIQKLCSIVKKRDPRVEQHYKEVGIAKSMQALQIEKKKSAEKEANKISRQEMLRAEYEYWLEMEKEKEKLIEQGQMFMDANSNSDENDNTSKYFNCDICKKTFKSQQQMESHLRSKKHQSLEKSIGK